MTQKKSAISNLIITLILALVGFHTFTYLQNFYNYYVTLGLFLLVIALRVYQVGGILKLRGHMDMVCLYAMTVVVIGVGVVVKGRDIVYMVGAYLPYVIWPTVYYISESLLDQKTKRKLMLALTAVIVVSAVATLAVLIKDNDAARLLAGAANDMVRSAYYRKGVGGYGFVYGCVFVIFGLIMWSSYEHSKLVKVSLLCTVALLMVMILYSSYTIALLLSIIVVCLTVYTKSKNKDATVMFVLLVIALALLMVPVLQLVHDLAKDLELEWIVNRTAQLLNAEESGEFGDLRRMRLYRLSWETFKNNPLLGGSRVGGHSMVFDHLGQYGIVGGLFCVSFFTWLIRFGKRSGSRMQLIYWMLFALLCINTANTIVMHPMVLYILPLMLSYKGEEETGIRKVAAVE